jgi:hypothetical protein
VRKNEKFVSHRSVITCRTLCLSILKYSKWLPDKKPGASYPARRTNIVSSVQGFQEFLPNIWVSPDWQLVSVRWRFVWRIQRGEVCLVPHLNHKVFCLASSSEGIFQRSIHPTLQKFHPNLLDIPGSSTPRFQAMESFPIWVRTHA